MLRRPAGLPLVPSCDAAAAASSNSTFRCPREPEVFGAQPNAYWFDCEDGPNDSKNDGRVSLSVMNRVNDQADCAGYALEIELPP